MKKQIENIDSKMLIMKEFLDEFYNKTVFKSENGSGTDLAPSFIKSVFAFADEDKAYPIGELGENARVKRSTMTDLVDRMEREGIAERIRDNNDRRLVKVRLTDKGKMMRRDFYNRRREECLDLFSQLELEEVNQFVHHLSEASIILKKIK